MKINICVVINFVNMRFDYIPKSYQMKIQPNSLWVAYNIANVREINTMLPFGMRAASIRILSTDTRACPKLLFNAYKVDAPFMSGHRLEVLTAPICG